MCGQLPQVGFVADREMQDQGSDQLRMLDDEQLNGGRWNSSVQVLPQLASM